MKTQKSLLLMTFFAVFGFQIGAQAASTQIIFKGAEAKMSMNLFKFQLKNKISDMNLALKFVPTEQEVKFSVQGLKKNQIKTRLQMAILKHDNCSIIKDNEPDQSMAEYEYRQCLGHAMSADTIVSLNPDWKTKVATEGKITLVREEMALEAVNADSDTVSILTSLATDVQNEVNFLRPNSSQVSVVTKN